MIPVDNKETLRSLSLRFIKVNRNRNLIAIIAIVLTSVLFTSVFTASFSVIKSSMESEMRKTMDRAHISFEDMTKEQYERIKGDREFKKQGLSIFLAPAENRELRKLQTEIRYGDANMAYSFMCTPYRGRLPVKKNEIATSTLVLDAFKLPHKTGQRIKLNFNLNKKKISKEFIISGFWKGDSIAMSQIAWVSREYCDSVVPNVTENELAEGNYTGGYNMSVWLSSSYGLGKKVEELESRYHLDNTNVKASDNPAYDIFGEDGFPLESVGLILLVIMLSGYLIIYNVFNISVHTDIRAYGLLKNIGTTGKQLKKIVRQQALYLSAVGIPLGMLFGFFIGSKMTPFLLADDVNGGNVPTQISFNPIIFIVAAIFSLATVYVGCLKPCLIVERLPPVEAVRMTETEEGSRKSKRTGRATPLSMALSNCRRSWKKGIGVVISLALSLFLLNVVFIIVQGFDFNSYTATEISSDFETSGFASDLRYANLNIISPKFRKAAEKNPNIKAAGYVYFLHGIHKLDHVLYGNLKKMIAARGMKNFPSHSQKYFKNMFRSRKVDSQVLGINKAIFDKLLFGEKKCSWEEFSKGKYVIVQNLIGGEFYGPGDKVNLEFGGNREKQYKCLSKANMPYSLGYMYYMGDVPQIFLIPDREFIKETGNDHAMIASFDVKDGTSKEVHKWIKEYSKRHSVDFTIKARYQIKKEFDIYVNKYYMIGGMLTAVLFIIGILNFLNTSITSILSRKRELSLLEVVGMTKKNVMKMLAVEGLCYVILAFVLSAIVSYVAMHTVIDATAGAVYFFSFHFSLLPSIVALPLIILIIILIPVVYYRYVCREAIVERIRKS